MNDPVLTDLGQKSSRLIAIKFVHTAIWALMVGCVAAPPVLALFQQFRWAFLLMVPVLAEILVLAINRWRCPLTGLAGQYTADRSPNFDIYLPRWLAEHNKRLFGTIFAVNALIVAGLWIWRSQ